MTMDLDSAPNFGLVANFHIPRVCNFDLMAIMNLRIYMRFDRKICSGSNFTPFVIIHGQILYEFSNLFSS